MKQLAGQNSKSMHSKEEVWLKKLRKKKEIPPCACFLHVVVLSKFSIYTYLYRSLQYFPFIILSFIFFLLLLHLLLLFLLQQLFFFSSSYSSASLFLFLFLFLLLLLFFHIPVLYLGHKSGTIHRRVLKLGAAICGGPIAPVGIVIKVSGGGWTQSRSPGKTG